MIAIIIDCKNTKKKKGYKYKKDTNKEIKINEYEVLFLILII